MHFLVRSTATVIFLAWSGAALAEQGALPCAYYGGTLNIEARKGNERSLGETSIFMPIACSQDRLLYSDIRYKTDNNDNHEGNVALGLRDLQDNGIVGVYAYLDRKRSGLTEKLHTQVTAGGEWLAENWEARINAYLPVTHEKLLPVGLAPGTLISNPYLAGSGIFVDQAGLTAISEVPLYGGDAEVGFKIPESRVWLHGAAFRFDGNGGDAMTGGRIRASWQVHDNLALLAEGQDDNIRERQGWIGARVTVPFGGPARKQGGLRERMTASPVRDIDIVTTGAVTQLQPEASVPVINMASGQQQRVIYVDNTAAGGGNGSLDRPFSTLAAAQAALQDYDTLYIARGDGTSTGMDSGLAISQRGIQVIGEGSAFVYDGTRFTTATGGVPTGTTTMRAAGLAPTITNTVGDGVSISGDEAFLTGFTVDAAAQDGIVIRADGAGASAQNVVIDNVSAQNNRIGVYLHGANDGAVSARIERSTATGNSQHGFAVYDDTNGTFEVDLGGGSLGSVGQNLLAGNGLEDLAVDYDGRVLPARNNWWGQATGADADNPSIGIAPQIYYGAPINDGLAGHWTFDTEWTSATTAYDRSGNANNGTFVGGLALTDQVMGIKREAFDFSDSGKYISVPDNASLDIPNTLTILMHLDKDTTKVGYAAHPITKWGPAAPTTNANYVLYDFGTTSGGLFPDNIVFYANAGGIWRPLAHQSYDYPGGSGPRYVGFVYDAIAGAQYYMNGIGLGALANVAAGPLATNNAPLLISPSGFDGRIDDIRIYSRALSAPEIAGLYRMDTASVVDTSDHLTAAP